MRIVVNGETVVIIMTKDEAIDLGNDLEWAEGAVANNILALSLEPATKDLVRELTNLEWTVT